MSKDFTKVVFLNENKGIFGVVIKVILAVVILAALLFFAAGVYFVKEQDESIWMQVDNLKEENKYIARAIRKLRPAVGKFLHSNPYEEYAKLLHYDETHAKNISRSNAKIDSLSMSGLVEYSDGVLEYFGDISKDASTLRNLWQNFPLSFPFSENVKFVVTRPFSEKIADPFTGEEKKHNGIDIAAETGTAVISPADGDVISVRNETFFGKTVKIKHSNGYETFYAHLGGVSVRVGQKIKRGTQIGTIGESGWTTGMHLHYELTKNGVHLDPMLYNFNLLYN